MTMMPMMRMMVMMTMMTMLTMLMIMRMMTMMNMATMIKMLTMLTMLMIMRMMTMIKMVTMIKMLTMVTTMMMNVIMTMKINMKNFWPSATHWHRVRYSEMHRKMSTILKVGPIYVGSTCAGNQVNTIKDKVAEDSIDLVSFGFCHHLVPLMWGLSRNRMV